MRHTITCTAALLASLIAGAAVPADTVPAAWETTIQQAAIVKEGMDRFRHPQYQYECLGLGGTVMRVGTDGFSLPGPGVSNTNGWLKHLPYLTYQYWWDEEAHRHVPFDLAGGYGSNLAPGQVTSFKHNLDIASGLLTIDLGLVCADATNAFQSRRRCLLRLKVFW